MNAIDVSSHEPQLHPPPASGDRTMPHAGTVLIQQPGRRRCQLVLRSFSKSHIVTCADRKMAVRSVTAYVPLANYNAMREAAFKYGKYPIAAGAGAEELLHL